MLLREAGRLCRRPPCGSIGVGDEASSDSLQVVLRTPSWPAPTDAPWRASPAPPGGCGRPPPNRRSRCKDQSNVHRPSLCARSRPLSSLVQSPGTDTLDRTTALLDLCQIYIHLDSFIMSLCEIQLQIICQILRFWAFYWIRWVEVLLDMHPIQECHWFSLALIGATLRNTGLS